MRRMILMGCFWMLTTAAYAQLNSTLKTANRDARQSSLAKFISGEDTTTISQNSVPMTNAIGGNPFATRFTSLQAMCDQNSVNLNWVAVQNSGADRYEIEESADGRNWINIGVVPASRTAIGEVSYTFKSARNSTNVQMRINAKNIAGESVYSSIIGSPCSNESYLGITPNPVYSTASVRIGAPASTRVRLLLVNTAGVVVQTREASLAAGINSVPLDMSSLQSGYYILSIHWPSGKQDVMKLIKQ